MNNKEMKEYSWKKKLEIILGGYCWAQDGGDGGYEIEDILDHIFKGILTTAKDKGWSHAYLEDLEDIVKELTQEER